MPTGTPLNLTKEFLEQEYVKLGRTCRQIAQGLGCDKKVISTHLKKYDIPIRKARGSKPRRLENKEFGLLTVVRSAGKNRHGQTKWQCECQCGSETTVLTGSLTSGHTTSCGCKVAKVASSRNKTVGGLMGTVWYGVQFGAKERGFPVTISQEDAWKLFENQGGKCALTGWEITLPQTSDRKTWKDHFASLDRIDSSKGYEPGNVQWVHKMVNLIKMHFPQEQFVQVCAAVTA